MSRTSAWLLGPVLVALLACKGGKSESSAAKPEEGQSGSTTSASSKSGSSTTSGNAPRPGAQPATQGKVRVVDTRGFVSESGFVTIIGEVFNDTGSWIDTINVEVTLLGEDGNPLSVDSVAAADGRGEGVVPDISVLAPGASSPFKYLRDIKKLAKPYKSHKLSAHAFGAKYQHKVSVTNINQSQDDLGWWKVTGTITNDGDRPCRYPEAVIGFYGEDGKIYDVNSAMPKDDSVGALAKGASWSFDRPAALEDREHKVKTLKVWGNCAQDDD
jgi:hypothetical protein